MRSSDKVLLDKEIDQQRQIQAQVIYGILVAMCGASPWMEENFVYHYPAREYRFQGDLGFGGKIYMDPFRVSCYREDETPERLKMIKDTNRLLSLIGRLR